MNEFTPQQSTNNSLLYLNSQNMTSTIKSRSNAPRFIYVLDPMCSWCWAFSAAVDTLKQRYAFPWTLLMGGLAPDSDEPMNKAMQQKLQAIWQHIE